MQPRRKGGVPHRDEWFFQPVQLRWQVDATLPAKNAELVFQPAHVGVAGVMVGGGLDVVLLVVLANNDVYLVAMRILIRIIGVVQGHAEAAFRTGLALPGQVQRHGAHPILVEGGNAALAGQVSGDAGYFHGLGMGGKE